jgi:hypothetical protein
MFILEGNWGFIIIILLICYFPGISGKCNYQMCENVSPCSQMARRAVVIFSVMSASVTKLR